MDIHEQTIRTKESRDLIDITLKQMKNVTIVSVVSLVLLYVFKSHFSKGELVIAGLLIGGLYFVLRHILSIKVHMFGVEFDSLSDQKKSGEYDTGEFN